MSSSEEAEFDGGGDKEEDSDDEPLSNLKSNGKKKRTKDDDDESEGEIYEAPDDDDDEGGEDDEEDYEEEDDDEKPRNSKKRKPNYAESSSDDDDDDIPLAALASNKKPKNGSKKPPATKKATPAKAKKTAVKKKPTTSSKVASSSSSSSTKGGNDTYQSPSAALYGSECQKGLLIQRLLCRWWFAITWPDPASIPSKPPQDYDALDGFPGVYVCTAGDDVGKIMDVRDKDQCPSFKNFAKKSSEELQQLLLDALKNQKKELIKVDGPGTPTEKELDNLIKWATKLKPGTAEKEAAKVLKASKLTLN